MGNRIYPQQRPLGEIKSVEETIVNYFPKEFKDEKYRNEACFIKRKANL